MVNTDDWVREVKRWVASGTRMEPARADDDPEPEALGYEAAQPALRARERPAEQRSPFG